MMSISNSAQYMNFVYSFSKQYKMVDKVPCENVNKNCSAIWKCFVLRFRIQKRYKAPLHVTHGIMMEFVWLEDEKHYI